MDNSSILEKLKEAIEETCSELGVLDDGMEIKYSYLCGQIVEVGYNTNKPSESSRIIDVIIVRSPHRKNGWNVFIYGIENVCSEFFVDSIRKISPKWHVLEGQVYNSEMIFIYISF